MPAAQVSLILDTNVVLDWLVFEDAHLVGLREAIREQRITLLTHALLLDELQRVLGYAKLNLDADQQQALQQIYKSQATTANSPADFSRHLLGVPTGFPRCRDADDDIFVALAYHAKATLVSKDHAVLKLKSRARKFAVTIIDVRELSSFLNLASR